VGRRRRGHAWRPSAAGRSAIADRQHHPGGRARGGAGIYAVTLGIEGGPALPAVASLGTNPTFVEDGDLVLEVHVLDWTGDLYGRRVRTTFVARLRDERKFDSVEVLVAQIQRDIAAARAALAR